MMIFGSSKSTANVTWLVEMQVVDTGSDYIYTKFAAV